MPILTIGSPTGTFSVVIKDSLGAIVYSGTQTNTPFDTGTLPAGDYICYVTYNGATNGWCFHVDDCPCLVPTLVEITDAFSGLRYAEFTFDLSGGFCPTTIQVTIGGGSSSLYYPIHLLTIFDFTSNIGDIYKKKILMPAGATWVTYQTFKNISGTYFPYPCMDNPLTVAAACDPSVIDDVQIVLESGVYKIRTTYSACGDTCNDMYWAFTQVGGISGVFSDTPVCSPATLTFDHVIVPTIITGAPITINFTATDCCGVSRSFTRSIATPCDGVEIELTSPAPVLDYNYIPSAGWFLHYQTNSCGGTCHSYVLTYAQILGAGESYTTSATGVGGSGTFTVPCGGSFPYMVNLALSPLSPTDGAVARVRVHITNCCGVAIAFDVTAVWP